MLVTFNEEDSETSDLDPIHVPEGCPADAEVCA